MRIEFRLSVAMTVLLALAAIGNDAKAQTIGSYGPYNWLYNTVANPFNGDRAGQYVALGGDYYPQPAPASEQELLNFLTTATVTATLGSQSINIPYAQEYGDPYAFYATPQYSSNLRGAWNFSVSHPGYTTATFPSNNTANTPFLPIVNSINVDGTSPGATINWTLPNINVPSGMNLSVNFEIIYKSESLYRPGELLDFYTLPASQTSLDLGDLPPFSSTAGNPPSIPLIAGQNYVIGIDAALTGSEGGVGYQYSEIAIIHGVYAIKYPGPIWRAGLSSEHNIRERRHHL